MNFLNISKPAGNWWGTPFLRNSSWGALPYCYYFVIARIFLVHDPYVRKLGWETEWPETFWLNIFWNMWSLNFGKFMAGNFWTGNVWSWFFFLCKLNEYRCSGLSVNLFIMKTNKIIHWIIHILAAVVLKWHLEILKF